MKSLLLLLFCVSLLQGAANYESDDHFIVQHNSHGLWFATSKAKIDEVCEKFARGIQKTTTPTGCFFYDQLIRSRIMTLVSKNERPSHVPNNLAYMRLDYLLQSEACFNDWYQTQMLGITHSAIQDKNSLFYETL